MFNKFRIETVYVYTYVDEFKNSLLNFWSTAVRTESIGSFFVSFYLRRSVDVLSFNLWIWCVDFSTGINTIITIGTGHNARRASTADTRCRGPRGCGDTTGPQVHWTRNQFNYTNCNIKQFGCLLWILWNEGFDGLRSRRYMVNYRRFNPTSRYNSIWDGSWATR